MLVGEKRKRKNGAVLVRAGRFFSCDEVESVRGRLVAERCQPGVLVDDADGVCWGRSA
ncbi:MAG: hypothetical protein QG581_185 [Patescibacteria group bacterium]|jgi:hypothetical protein|nr:hypothetical protein [Patescibacteria group bacterium]